MPTINLGIDEWHTLQTELAELRRQVEQLKSQPAAPPTDESDRLKQIAQLGVVCAQFLVANNPPETTRGLPIVALGALAAGLRKLGKAFDVQADQIAFAIERFVEHARYFERNREGLIEAQKRYDAIDPSGGAEPPSEMLRRYTDVAMTSTPTPAPSSTASK